METMPAREIYCPDRDSIPVSQDTMMRNQQQVDKTMPQTSQPSGLASHLYNATQCISTNVVCSASTYITELPHVTIARFYTSGECTTNVSSGTDALKV